MNNISNAFIKIITKKKNMCMMVMMMNIIVGMLLHIFNVDTTTEDQKMYYKQIQLLLWNKIINDTEIFSTMFSTLCFATRFLMFNFFYLLFWFKNEAKF